jgi:nicotinamide-nucleotide amidase
MDSSVNPTLAPYAKEGEVRLRITAAAESKEKANEMCNALADKVLETEVGKYVYGVDVGSVENAVLEELRRDGETLAVAESCTGGLISKRITDISGASDVFLGGAVTYANEAKIKMLGVSEETLRKHGAVSEETAIEMSRGIRRVTGSDFGISTTGIAGPTGGSEEKPVGTVYISVDSKYGSAVKKLTLSPMRDREYIRMVSATLALYLVLEAKHSGSRAEGAQPE